MAYSIHLNTGESKKAAIFVRAIVELAKADVAYSFFVSKVLWGASLYLHRGVFAEQWRIYDRISDAARAIRDGGQKNWKKQLTFEHCKPLKAVYLDLLKVSEALTLERAISILSEYPPVLITRIENDRIPNQHRSAGDPVARYASAGITCSFALAVPIEPAAGDHRTGGSAPLDHSRVCPECGQEVLEEE